MALLAHFRSPAELGPWPLGKVTLAGIKEVAVYALRPLLGPFFCNFSTLLQYIPPAENPSFDLPRLPLSVLFERNMECVLVTG